MRTYESTMAEIEQIQAEQRAITQKAEPTADDTAFLLKAEGELSALRKVANDLHTAEVADLKAAAERAVPVVTDELREKNRATRELLRSLPGEFVEIGMPGGEERAFASNSGSGSYLVPQEWHNKVEEYRFEKNWLRQEGATVIRTASTHNIPVLSANGTAAITGENAAYTNSEPTISQVILYAYKMTDKALVSEELIEDTVYDLEGTLAKSMGYSFGAAELAYGMTGTGSSQPTGIFNKAADLTTATQGVVTADELLGSVYANGEYKDGAVWMMDPTTAAAIAKLLTPVATSGGQNYQFPSMLDALNPSLFGYKVKLATAIANYGANVKAIAFGPASEYVIGERGPIQMKRMELNEYQTTFAWKQRIDMKPLNPAAFYVIALKA